MVTTEQRDDTKDKIVEAALKRFIHYGAGKTTMNDIAEDLHCSKASLYYYFSDKQSLHMAVLEKISETLFQQIESEVDKMTSAEQILTRLLGIKYEFATRFFRLEIFKIIQEMKLITSEQFAAFRMRELAIFTKIFEAGNASGEFALPDPAGTAALYQDAVEGIRFCITDGMSAFHDNNEVRFEKIITQQRLLAEIFINGLKYQRLMTKSHKHSTRDV